ATDTINKIRACIWHSFLYGTPMCHSGAMDRDFRAGHIEIDFPAEPFTSPARLLARSVRLFLANFGLVAAITLAIFLPGKLALQFACYVSDIPTGGVLSYVLLEASDLILGALAVPALVYRLIGALRPGNAP